MLDAAVGTEDILLEFMDLSLHRCVIYERITHKFAALALSS